MLSSTVRRSLAKGPQQTWCNWASSTICTLKLALSCCLGDHVITPSRASLLEDERPVESPPLPVDSLQIARPPVHGCGNRHRTIKWLIRWEEPDSHPAWPLLSKCDTSRTRVPHGSKTKNSILSAESMSCSEAGSLEVCGQLGELRGAWVTEREGARKHEVGERIRSGWWAPSKAGSRGHATSWGPSAPVSCWGQLSAATHVSA